MPQILYVQLRGVAKAAKVKCESFTTDDGWIRAKNDKGTQVCEFLRTDVTGWWVEEIEERAVSAKALDDAQESVRILNEGRTRAAQSELGS
jgi:hypothetical protein